MIHFFPTFSKDARRSPFAQELTALNVPYLFFPGEVILQYHWRIWLLFFGWPKVGLFAIKSAIRSMVLSKPYPDMVVIGSHIEALIFGAFRALFWRKNPEIVWLGFIFTSRHNALLNKIRSFYIGCIFLIVDKVICHSTLEVERYTKLFKNSRAKFVFIPYGLHLAGREELMEKDKTTSNVRPYILAAGRSGRDYATLFEAIESLPIDLHVVCDNAKALAGLNIPKNVLVLRECYGSAYFNELNNSLFVVIPLGVNDISAGQMVLIQAMAFAKPTIITRTSSVEEYVMDHEQSLLVTQGSASELRAAISKLLADHELANHLSTNAIDAFENRYCMKAFVKNLVACLMPPVLRIPTGSP